MNVTDALRNIVDPECEWNNVMMSYQLLVNNGMIWYLPDDTIRLCVSMLKLNMLSTPLN
jgi:hypothetical protein